MKSRFFRWLSISIVIMIILPWLTIDYAESDDYKNILFLLFFVINPLYSAVVGIFSGRNLLELWAIPNITALLFLLGSWIFFDRDESNAYLIYSGIYMLISLSSMFVTIYIRKLLIKYNHGLEDRFQIIYSEI